MEQTTAAGGPGDARRHASLRRGVVLSAITVLWNIVEGVVAVAAGALSGSVALVAFGVDSFIETASALIVGWRLAYEMGGRPIQKVERAEGAASRVAGGLLLLLALYVLVDAGRRLFGFGAEPGPSPLGMILTAVSAVLMPLLAWAKLRTARALSSRALRADAFETIACTWLSLTTLAGLTLNAWLGWWWADPVAGLVLVPLIVREGLEGLRGEEDEDEDDDD